MLNNLVPHFRDTLLEGLEPLLQARFEVGKMVIQGIVDKGEGAADNHNDLDKRDDNSPNVDRPVKGHKLPRRVVLDKHIVVHVRMLSPHDMTMLAGPGFTPKGVKGFWEDLTKTIAINSSLNDEEKWATFRHELIHAIIDIDNEVSNSPTYKSAATRSVQEASRAEGHHKE